MLAALMLAASLLAFAPPGEVLADIQVHGNTVTTDAAVIRLAGVQLGSAVTEQTFTEASERLKASRKFARVEVLKRFASIADPTQIVMVIVVDEGPVTIRAGDADPGGAPPTVQVLKSRRLPVMVAPILNFEDGHRFTYGAQFALPKIVGDGSRLALPFTWGGTRRAGAMLEKPVATPFLSRLQGGAEITQTENLYFRAADDRDRLWLRAERDVQRWLRIGASGAWEHVSFMSDHDRFVRVGADVVVDNRIDPVIARQAIYLRAAWDHFDFAHATDADRGELDARGYIGLPRQAVLVVGGLGRVSDHRLPDYLRPLLGGADNLRGFAAGSAVGDTLVASSVEVRVPLTSPLNVAKFGVSAFVDAGAVSDHGERLRSEDVKKGIGGGIWISATVFRFSLDVAHGVGSSTRVHVGTTLLF